MLRRLIPAALRSAASEPLDLLTRDMATLQDAALALHMAADHIDLPYQATMWAPHLDATAVPWYAICREHHQMAALRKAGVRCVWAPRAHHLTKAMAPGVRAVLYVNNSHRNLEVLRRFPDLVHVQMLHGDSDKPPSYSPVTAIFDRVFVAGQLGQDRYARHGVTIPEQAFVHVGRPQLRGRSVGPRSGWRECPVIAYMPTWIGEQADAMFSSLARGPEVIRAIRRASPQAEILFKPHPSSYKDPSWKTIEAALARAVAETGATLLDRAHDANLVYERSDLLLTDISSTISDFLHSERPLVVILPASPLRDRGRAFPMLSACYQVAANLSDIDARLADALGDDSLAGARASMRHYAFGSDEGPADARFIEAIRRLARDEDG